MSGSTGSHACGAAVVEAARDGAVEGAPAWSATGPSPDVQPAVTAMAARASDVMTLRDGTA
jgi:hypothetical protein